MRPKYILLGYMDPEGILLLKDWLGCGALDPEQ